MGSSTKNIVVLEKYSHPLLIFQFLSVLSSVSIGNSTNKSLWFIYVTINELPFKDRSNYMLLAGLYVGSKDPI